MTKGTLNVHHQTRRAAYTQQGSPFRRWQEAAVGIQTGRNILSLNLPGGLAWLLLFLSDSGPEKAWAQGV